METLLMIKSGYLHWRKCRHCGLLLFRDESGRLRCFSCNSKLESD